MGFGFAPRGWARCDGQLLPINQNQALFSLLGTTFGGDGRVNFGLPDFRGRVPVQPGSGFTLGQRGGEQGHTISISELPQHTHAVNAASANGSTPLPGGALLAAANNLYAPATNLTSLHPATVTNAGGSQAHQNMQPFSTLTFCIALQGIYPSP